MARRGRGARASSRASRNKNAVANDPALAYTETAANLDTIGGDSEDEFHDQRGQIDLDDTIGHASYADHEQDQEVFGLEGVDESEDDESDDDESGTDESDEEEDEDEILLERLRSQGLYLKGNQSDSDDDNDDDDTGKAGKKTRSKSQSKDDVDDMDGGWGKRRGVYYDADDLSEEEDAKEEEKEALRLQRKQMEALAADDFLEDSFENILRKKKSHPTSKSASASSSDAIQDALLADAEQIRPDLSQMSESEKSRLARRTLPEVVALLDEFKSTFSDLRTATKTASKKDVCSPSMLARSLYLTNMAFFFALAADSDTVTRRSHPVIEQLAALQKLVVALPLDSVAEDSDLPDQQSTQGLELSRQSADDSDFSSQDDESIEPAHTDSAPAANKASKKEKKSKKVKKAKKKAKAATDDAVSRVEIPVEHYEDVPVSRSRAKSAKNDDHDASDDADGVDAYDENDLSKANKTDRTRSLKFHANRVDQSVASSQSLKRKLNSGGDDDLPYRDVKASQQAANDRALKLALQAEENFAGDQDGEDEEGLALYEQYAAKRVKKMTDKETQFQKARADAMHVAAYGTHDFNACAIKEGEKRKATWKILANKGLTPHRKKEDRNPRVKKRMRYEKAKKKLSSFRRVATDKSKLGNYSGEATGIKANLARSIKF